MRERDRESEREWAKRAERGLNNKCSTRFERIYYALANGSYKNQTHTHTHAYSCTHTHIHTVVHMCRAAINKQCPYITRGSTSKQASVRYKRRMGEGARGAGVAGREGHRE